MFERLSGDYNRGYTKAIQDIISIFEYVQYDLDSHKRRMNYKLSIDLLNTILENRESIRESRKGFIRWNSGKSSFEYFSWENL